MNFYVTSGTPLYGKINRKKPTAPFNFIARKWQFGGVA